MPRRMCLGSTWILEKAGVLELLTKSLVQLYEEPEKPNDALTYLKKTVGVSDDENLNEHCMKMMDGGHLLAEHVLETLVPHAACSGHLLVV